MVNLPPDPGPPPELAHAATAAFLTAGGTVVGGFLELGSNLGNVNPWASRQLVYAARDVPPDAVVVEVVWFAAIVDDDPHDASPMVAAPSTPKDATALIPFLGTTRLLTIKDLTSTTPLYVSA